MSAAKGREIKVNVHHKSRIADWESVIDSVYREILCDPENLETLCVDCHKLEAKNESYNK
jgi:hypothetical protein